MGIETRYLCDVCGIRVDPGRDLEMAVVSVRRAWEESPTEKVLCGKHFRSFDRMRIRWHKEEAEKGSAGIPSV